MHSTSCRYGTLAFSADYTLKDLYLGIYTYHVLLFFAIHPIQKANPLLSGAEEDHRFSTYQHGWFPRSDCNSWRLPSNKEQVRGKRGYAVVHPDPKVTLDAALGHGTLFFQ